jgi:imidazolonepropionase
MSDVFLTGVGHLTTNDGPPLADAVVAIEGGVVTYAGPAADAPDQTGERVDCDGRAVIPGFVDAHTHLVFAGDRSDEFSRRLAGASYAEIARAGGGILSTVAATRGADEETLFRLAAERVGRMVAAGTTTVEIKSGYGLDLETEILSLRVARRIGDELPVTVKTTFLGGHSIPPEFESDREGYIDLVIEDMLPAVSGLADYCDVFV